MLARDVVEGAFNRSLKNTPAELESAGVVWAGFVDRALRGLFAWSARVNPFFFTEPAPVDFVAPGWQRPADAELVWRLENPAGEEVVIVPAWDRAAEPSRPAVYALGQVYRGAGNARDPVDGPLTFFYARGARPIADLDDAIDPLWPAQYRALLELEVAMRIAGREGRVRADELAELAPQRAEWLKLYAAFLEHETIGMRSRYALPQTPATALAGLLIGGEA